MGWLWICAYLASCLHDMVATSELVRSLLSPSGVTSDTSFLLEASYQPDQQHLQHKWDELLYEQHYSSLLNSSSNDQFKARLLTVKLVPGLMPCPCLHWVPNLMMNNCILFLDFALVLQLLLIILVFVGLKWISMTPRVHNIEELLMTPMVCLVAVAVFLIMLL